MRMPVNEKNWAFALYYLSLRCVRNGDGGALGQLVGRVQFGECHVHHEPEDKVTNPARANGNICVANDNRNLAPEDPNDIIINIINNSSLTERAGIAIQLRHHLLLERNTNQHSGHAANQIRHNPRQHANRPIANRPIQQHGAADRIHNDQEQADADCVPCARRQIGSEAKAQRVHRDAARVHRHVVVALALLMIGNIGVQEGDHLLGMHQRHEHDEQREMGQDLHCAPIAFSPWACTRKNEMRVYKYGSFSQNACNNKGVYSGT